MCGIAGYWRAGSTAEALSGIGGRMAAALRHRGPDDEGIWLDPEAGLVLVHRRLAIVDLTAAGHQPMRSANGRYRLTFNGEIYNHLDIRRELEAGGLHPVWRGHSDTETLLAAIAAWGLERALQKSVGMFALTLWDGVEQTLQLARDRLGEKPLYYGWVAGGLAFASELKALRHIPGFDNGIDRQALSAYLQFLAVPSPLSIHTGLHKLPPAGILTVGRTELTTRTLPQATAYWSLAGAVSAGMADPLTDEAGALDELDRLLRAAVGGQMMADVPLGAFLSGGIDSSVVVALMQAQSSRPVQTFTIGFDEAGYDEAPHAAAVARHLGTDHHEIRVTSAEALATVPGLAALYDEPFGDSSQLPTYLVSRAARQSVTVSLSGDGGDEVFGGYNRHRWAARLWRQMQTTPPAIRRAAGGAMLTVPIGVWEVLGRALPLNQPGLKAHKFAQRLQTVGNLDDLYDSFVSEWSPGSLLDSEPRAAVGADFAALTDPSLRMMALDTARYLPDDILAKVDRAAMAISLETRVPILDHRVVEFAWRLPRSMKIRNHAGKWALRQVLYRYVPRELVERPKAGFAVPVAEWLRGPLRDWAEARLDAASLAGGELDSRPINARWREHLSGRRDWSASLWAVLMFEDWRANLRSTPDV